MLLEKASPPDLLEAIVQFRATVSFTAPTSYRAMAAGAKTRGISALHGGSLRKCVSAGETLPAATRTLWRESTGIELIDGIGATEMLHIFISADEPARALVPPASPFRATGLVCLMQTATPRPSTPSAGSR